MLVKLVSTAIGLFGATFLFWSGIAFEHRPAGWPNLSVPIGPFHWTLHLPDGPYVRLAELESAEAAAAARAKATEAAQARASTSIAAADKAAQTVIQTRTITLTKEIPTYVTAQAVAACPIPVGFVRLFNAAASGVDVSGVPGPAGKPNDAASGVGLDTVAQFTIDNDGAALANARQLSDLQAWVRAMQALNPRPVAASR